MTSDHHRGHPAACVPDRWQSPYVLDFIPGLRGNTGDDRGHVNTQTLSIPHFLAILQVLQELNMLESQNICWRGFQGTLLKRVLDLLLSHTSGPVGPGIYQRGVNACKWYVLPTRSSVVFTLTLPQKDMKVKTRLFTQTTLKDGSFNTSVFVKHNHNHT